MESERLAALKTLLSTATDDEVVHMHDAVRREFVARANRESGLYPPMPTPRPPASETPVRVRVTKQGRTTAQEWPSNATVKRTVPLGKIMTTPNN